MSTTKTWKLTTGMGCYGVEHDLMVVIQRRTNRRRRLPQLVVTHIGRGCGLAKVSDTQPPCCDDIRTSAIEGLRTGRLVRVADEIMVPVLHVAVSDASATRQRRRDRGPWPAGVMVSALSRRLGVNVYRVAGAPGIVVVEGVGVFTKGRWYLPPRAVMRNSVLGKLPKVTRRYSVEPSRPVLRAGGVEGTGSTDAWVRYMRDLLRPFPASAVDQVVVIATQARSL